MSPTATFRSVLEDADQLTLDEQETLIEVLRHRTVEQRRRQIVEDIHEAEEQFRRGECKPTTVADLMAELRQ
ncbi:MAG: hypothetical protein NTZ32_26345 [Planctomycetales bacterium]|nr:hypothetical protein [Planctomycetales bacterium]